MHIDFCFNGLHHVAHIVERTNSNIEVEVKDEDLGKQFGYSFRYQFLNNSLDFTPLNLCHSQLYALQSEIKKSLLEQALRPAPSSTELTHEADK